MKSLHALIIPLILCAGCQSPELPESAKNESKLDAVDPLIGTDTWKGEVTVPGHEEASGFVYPGVAEPFGKTAWTAHTMRSKRTRSLHDRVPYWYNDKYISGFLGTHYPNGSVMFDYGAVELMPLVGELKTKPEERSSTYSHDGETSKANYYSVLLNDSGVQAELTATKNAAIHQYTFPQSDDAYVIVDALPTIFTASSKASVNINPERNEISGRSAMTARSYRETGYYVVQFDKAFDEFGTFNHNKQYPEVIEIDYLFHEEEGQLVNGLKGTYVQDKKVVERVDPVIDFDWAYYQPADDFGFDDFVATWQGKLKAPETGTYKIGIQASEFVSVSIGGKVLFDNAKIGYAFAPPLQQDIHLEAGQLYDIEVQFKHKGGDAKFKLSWLKPSEVNAKEVFPGNKALALSTKIGAYLKFKTVKGEVVKAKVGTSFISVEQARANIEKEIPHWDFDRIRTSTGEKWEKELSVIDLKNVDDDTRAIFYTALHRNFLLPRSISENGRYRSPFDGQIYEGDSYTDYSLWDTYRATHPLLVLLKPEKVPALINGLLNAYEQGGWLPKWPNPGYTNCMYGTHADAVISDAYIKGIRGFDTEKAEEAMLKNANEKGNYMSWGRWGVEDYNNLGYVPIDDVLESVARTMEFSFDDFCIAQYLDATGKPVEAEDMYQRSQRFMNVLDPQTRLARGKHKDGTWAHPDDGAISAWSGTTPKDVRNYKMNYTIGAPHDLPAIIEFLGGNDSMTDFLDELFEDQIYYVGDEMSMHAPYIYNVADIPWRTQERASHIVNSFYKASPGGLPGNEDAGQLSAWYLFSAMGFYPVTPGTTEYQIGTPNLPHVVFNLHNGNTFEIVAHNQSKQNIYIQSAMLNGKQYNQTTLDHFTILAGGKLEFEMGDNPSSWGSSSKEEFERKLQKYNRQYKASAPYLTSDSQRQFYKETTIGLMSDDDGAVIYYTLDGTTPTRASNKYVSPFVIDKSVTLNAISFLEGSKSSDMMSKRLLSSVYPALETGYPKFTYDKTGQKYGKQDGSQFNDLEFGSLKYADGNWMGVNNHDVEVFVDFGQQISVNEIELYTLSATGSWIFPPKSIRIYKVLHDGSEQEIAHKPMPELTVHDNSVSRHIFAFDNQSAAKLKIEFEHYGPMPSWHTASGSASWIFLDEINVN